MSKTEQLTTKKLREIENFRKHNSLKVEEELVFNNEYALKQMLRDHYNQLDIQKEEIRNKQKLIRAIEHQIKIIERKLKVFGWL